MTASNLVLVALAAVLAGCGTTRQGSEIDLLMTQAVRAAQQRTADGDVFEAWQLLRAASSVDPEHPGIAEARAALPEDFVESQAHWMLGSNVAQRERIDAPWWRHALLYIPDRILDVFDVFSIDVHFGLGLFVDAHATRAVQFTAGARGVAGLGWHPGRSLGIQTQGQSAISLLPFGAESYSALRAGTSGVDAGHWGLGGLHGPGKPLYQEGKDYWSIGGGATAGVVGVDVDVHLLQIFDLVVGFLLFDPLRDDFATTSGLDLSRSEETLVRTLAEVAADDDDREAYLIHRSRLTRHDDEPGASSAPEASDGADADAPPADPADGDDGTEGEDSGPDRG